MINSLKCASITFPIDLAHLMGSPKSMHSHCAKPSMESIILSRFLIVISAHSSNERTCDSEPGCKIPFNIDNGIACKSGLTRKAARTPVHKYFRGIIDASGLGLVTPKENISDFVWMW